MARNKRRVVIAVYHRDQESLGPNRQRLGHAAYHWAILIIPKSGGGPVCWAFDVTNGAKPATGLNTQDLNPHGDWWYRSRTDADKERSSHLLAMAMIGKLPPGVFFGDVDSVLRQLPVPQRHQIPEENCVSWTRDAIRALERAGYSENLSVEHVMNSGLRFADEVMNRSKNAQTVQNLTKRPM
ncbi:hypothetical protein SLS57_012499 [Botryosphaeria dothidea]